MRRLAIGIGLTVFAGLAAFAFAVGPYRTVSAGMEPAVQRGDRMLLLRVGYAPSVGDIAAFGEPSDREIADCPVDPPRGAMCVAPVDDYASGTLLQRVVAGPGDRISLRPDGHLVRNGVTETRTILPCDPECPFPTEVTVPKGHWFVLGDNRAEAADSRNWGTVPADEFVGRRFIGF